MARQQLGVFIVYVLAMVVTASILANVSASAGDVLQRLLGTDSEPTSLRLEMRPHEPPMLSTSGRVAHHVLTSIDRAKMLYSGFHASGAATWDSNVTTIRGAYVMSLSLGSPPQTFSVIVDTGSDLTWVQAKGCTTCIVEHDGPYDYRKSSSYMPLSCSSSMCSKVGEESLNCTDSRGNCQYVYKYGDQSITKGVFSTEIITVSTTQGSVQRIPGFAFGAGLQNSLSFQGVAGLVGLGQGPISFPSQLGEDYGNVFSYCLVNWYDSQSQTSPLIFGSAAVPFGDVLYTPLMTDMKTIVNPTYWFVNLTGVSVEDEKFDFSQTQGLINTQNHKTIIDSGTTLSFLDTSIYKALKTSLGKSISYPIVSGGNAGLDLCFNTSTDPNPTFPGTTFHFEGADWVLPQENTFVQTDNHGTWCLAMVGLEQSLQIFGNFQQQNFQVIYDKPNSRLGSVKKQCDNL